MSRFVSVAEDLQTLIGALVANSIATGCHPVPLVSLRPAAPEPQQVCEDVGAEKGFASGRMRVDDACTISCAVVACEHYRILHLDMLDLRRSPEVEEAQHVSAFYLSSSCNYLRSTEASETDIAILGE